jgi:homoserine O-acetyltransferase
LKKIKIPAPFVLESGEVLPFIEIGYHTFGVLNEQKNNVIWVCHALTANSDPTDWWSGLVGEGKVINPDENFIVCANIIGSCYGTTHPLSINPMSSTPYYDSFPLITIRDMVKAHILLADHLGVREIKLLIGGSMGGQQALEWSVMCADDIKNLLVIATNAAHYPYGIAFNESQRLSIYADPSYWAKTAEGGTAGLKAARSIALISYRSYAAYGLSQAEKDIDKYQEFRAASYQRYQGEKLVKRFDAYSYVSLTKSMDSHNLGRGRSKLETALEKIKAKTLCISIESDALFPPTEQFFLAKHIKNSYYEIIDSPYGHDGFLLETEKLSALIKKYNLC